MEIKSASLREERKKWEFIYEHFYQSLCYFSFTILNDSAKAQDIVQSVLVKLWKEKTTFEDIAHTRNYLYKSVRNATINELNTEASHAHILKGLAEQNPKIYQQDDHFHAMVKAELYKRILDAVDILPDKTAKVFKLAFLEQKSNPEIADLLSISINTVKVHKNNAKKSLQRLLKNIYPLVAFIFWETF